MDLIHSSMFSIGCVQVTVDCGVLLLEDCGSAKGSRSDLPLFGSAIVHSNVFPGVASAKCKSLVLVNYAA